MGRYLGQVDQEQAPPPSSGNRRLIEALQQNWLAEMEGTHTYRMLAEQENDPTRREVLLELAEAEEHHASNWARRLQQLGAETPVPGGSLGQQARDRVIKGGGTMAVIRKMEADEDRDIARYKQQLPSCTIRRRSRSSRRRYATRSSIVVRCE